MFKQVGRSVARSGIARPGAMMAAMPLLARVSLAYLATSSTSPSVEAAQVPKKKNSNTPSFKNRKPKNRKLVDIRNQIRDVIQKETSLDLSESVQILDEGLSYLREIQEAENISEEDFFALFENTINELIVKACQPGANLGNDLSVEDLLDKLINYRVAQGYSFAKVMAKQLKEVDESSADALPTYEKVLNLWVKYCHYTKQQPAMSKRPSKALEGKFYRNDVLYLAYYAYVQSVLQSGAHFDAKTVMKIFQIEDFPSVFYIGQTIVRYEVKSSMKEYNSEFGAKVAILNVETLDPNGKIAVTKILRAVDRKSLTTLRKVHQEILEASTANGKPIDESTLVRLMSAYAYLESFEDVFVVFKEMISNGIEKPTNAAWENMLLSYTHPRSISGKNESEKDSLALNVEQFVSTMISNGNQITSKTLAIIIGCFANLGKFDLVDKYLEQYKDVPMIHLTRNNILLGYLSNRYINEAEKKMKEFQEQDPLYYPSVNVMNSFIKYYVDKKDYDIVENLLKFMKEKSINYDLATYTILLDMYFKISLQKGQSPSMQIIFDLVQDAKKNSVEILNGAALNTLINGLCKNGANIEVARLVFEFAEKKRLLTPPLVTTMLAAELEFGSIKKVSKLLNLYNSRYGNQTRVWNLVCKGLLTRDEDLAFEFFTKFRDESTAKPNFFTYYFLLNHFIRKDDSTRVQALINDLNEGKLSNLGNQLPALLKANEGKYAINHDLIA